MYGTRRPATTESILPPREIRQNTAARRAWLDAKLAEILAEGREAKITGKGSYQQISVKIVRERATKTQTRGLCQVCGGEWAIVGREISHHGYQRPGWGFQTASCMGARHVSLAEGKDALVAAIVAFAEAAVRADARAVETETAETLTVTVNGRTINRRGDREKVAVEIRIDAPIPTSVSYHRTFEEIRAARVDAIRREAEGLRAYVADLREREAAFDRGEFAGTTRDVEVPA